jgi:hydroxymethylglutaryl-CoA reductase
MKSRLPGFYELPHSERLHVASEFAGLGDMESESLGQFGALTPELTDVFIENAIGTFSLPLGVATNFLINGKDTLIPMAVEETSVLAAASHGAKLARSGGGFVCKATDPIMTGQIQLFVKEYTDEDRKTLEENRGKLISLANRGHDSLVARGGGARDIEWRWIPDINSIVVHLYVDTRDAMGANIVNTMCERLATHLATLLCCDTGLRILTNLTDRRLARAECTVLKEALDSREYRGTEVVDRIVKAWEFAWYDVYRATTNNKGIMNGIDPVLIATGNDWRAIEAGAHAWTCRSGTYRPMAKWSKDPIGNLHGELEIPMAVGTVGGVTKLHPTAKAALRMMGSPNARELAGMICAVGLAQNLSALRALASEGIQRGHMGLHHKNLELLAKGSTK